MNYQINGLDEAHFHHPIGEDSGGLAKHEVERMTVDGQPDCACRMSLKDVEIGVLGALDLWLYRGWRYLFSSKYRAYRHKVWQSSSTAYVVWDILATWL